MALCASKLLPQEDLQSSAAVEATLCLSRLCLSSLCLQFSFDPAYVCQSDESLALLGWLWFVWGWVSVKFIVYCFPMLAICFFFFLDFWWANIVGDVECSLLVVQWFVLLSLVPFFRISSPVFISPPSPHPSGSASFKVQIQRLGALNSAKQRSDLQNPSFWRLHDIKIMHTDRSSLWNMQLSIGREWLKTVHKVKNRL